MNRHGSSIPCVLFCLLVALVPMAVGLGFYEVTSGDEGGLNCDIIEPFLSVVSLVPLCLLSFSLAIMLLVAARPLWMQIASPILGYLAVPLALWSGHVLARASLDKDDERNQEQAYRLIEALEEHWAAPHFLVHLK
jgi:hypothetical protein